MKYLAIVEKRRHLSNTNKLQLLLCCRSDGSWIKHQEVIDLPVSLGDRHHEGVLLLVELDPKRQISKIQLAAGEIVRLLLDLNHGWDEIKEWRDSLEEQRVEIDQRWQELYDTQTETTKNTTTHSSV